MYGAMCQNMGTLTVRFQQLLINKLVEVGLAQEVNLGSDDSYYTAIKRVIDPFKIAHPLFERMVKFINLEAEPGERGVDTARRLYKLAQLAELSTINAQELILMKFSAMTADGKLRQKI